MQQNLSIRAIDIIDDQKICFAANNGIFGYSDDGGKNWFIDTIRIKNYAPQFRSIEALNDSTILILSIDSPAYLLKTTNMGRDWKVVYENHEKGIFFDAMKARNNNEIWAIGDPIDNISYLIYSDDAGNNWQKYDNKYSPIIKNKEAFFAASNSNIAFINNQLFIVSGGSNSNLIKLNLKKNTHSKKKLPFTITGNMCGAYSIDIFDKNNFVISGGNYDKLANEYSAFYFTKDGGKSFETINYKENFFGSCVKYLSKNEFFVTGHAGTFYVNLKRREIKEIKDKQGNKLKFHTLRISDNKTKIILAGSEGRIASININEIPFR